MTKTNILFAHNVGKIGGAEKVTLDIISGLDESAYGCHLMTPENGPLLDAAIEANAQTVVFNVVQPSLKNLVNSFIFNTQIKSYVKRHNISVIHTGDIFVARALIPVAKALNLHLVCHMHFPPDDGALNWVFKKTPANLSFIYCSQELHDNVQPRVVRLAPHASHKVIHNGVDINLFQKSEHKLSLLPENKTNIGIVANLQERKGHKEFIEAAAELTKKHDNLLFHIIGGDVFGEQRQPELEKKVSELNLENSICFHGQVNNVKDYLNELDIYVCSSYEEAFPISILEAMAYELPIASTNVNGIPEALTHNETALLFEPRDTQALAAALELYLEHTELKETLARKAKEKVRSSFSKTVFCQNVTSIY